MEKEIRRQIPPSELATIIDNIGVPYSSINLSYSTSAPMGPGDADIQVELQKNHRPTKEYVRKLRSKLPTIFRALTSTNCRWTSSPKS